MSATKGRGPNPRYGMVIDLDRCTGCEACVVACAMENNVPPASREEARAGREIRWMDMMTIETGGKVRLVPRPCMHCQNPPCTRVCPTQATYLSEETGIVGQVFSRCIGCRYCTTACPYTLRYFNWTAPEWPEPLGRRLNPDVSVRPKGVVEKCTLCSHRLQRARDEAAAAGHTVLPGEYVPACVEVCPARAIVFGDLNDPNSEVARLAHSMRVFTYLHDLGTHPSVFYLREGE